MKFIKTAFLATAVTLWLSASLAQKIPVRGTRGAELRFDVLNLLDTSYQLRDGTGVGVGAPQFGLRRTFLVTLAQKF